MSNRVKKASRQLTCHHDSDPAAAVCGECGKPLCQDHERTLTDPLFSVYRGSYVPLILGLLSLLVVPGLLLGVVDSSLFTDLERQVFGQQIGLRTGLVVAAVLIGAAGLLVTWFQGSDTKTSSRLLVRESPERSMCEECYQNTSLRRLTSIGMWVLGVLLILGGVLLVVQSKSGILLTVSGLGVLIYALRHDAALYLLNPEN